MTPTKPQTVEEYLTQLPPQRREAVAALRQLILQEPSRRLRRDHPLRHDQLRHPFGHLSSHLQQATTVLCRPRLPEELHLPLSHGHLRRRQTPANGSSTNTRTSGKKIDLGKACLRFKTLDDLPLDLVAQAVARTSVADFIRLYEASRPSGP